MAQGKGVGPETIIAVAVVSTIITIILDHFGITTAVEKLIHNMKGK